MNGKLTIPAKRVRTLSRALRIAGLALWLCGCTGAPLAEKGVYPVALVPASSKINLNIQLEMEPALREAALHPVAGNGSYGTLPLGENLTLNLPNVTRAAFSVVRVASAGEEPDRSKVDALLRVRLVSAADTGSKLSWQQRTSTILLEWTLTDLDGHVRWAETVRGAITAKVGNRPHVNRNANERFRAVVADVCQKSFQSLSSAPTIKDFAESKRKSPQN